MSNENPTSEAKHYQHMLVALQHATKALAFSAQKHQTIKELECSKNLALATLYLVTADEVMNPDDLTLSDQKMQLNQAIYLLQQQITAVENELK